MRAGQGVVALLGPHHAGTSSLVDALHTGGPGPVARPDRLRARTTTTGPTLIDIPGDPDLAGDLPAGLHAADAAVLVLPAVPARLTEAVPALWRACVDAELPRLVALTGVDLPDADADDAAALAARLLGEPVLATHLPVHDDDGTVAGLFSLLDGTLSEGAGAGRTVRPADPEHLALAAEAVDDLTGAVLADSPDEDLLDHYLLGVRPGPTRLAAELAAAVGRGSLVVAVPVSARTGVGTAELAGLLAAVTAGGHRRPTVTAADGNPVRPLTDDDPRLAAQLIEVDPAGRALVRVAAGTLRPGRVALAGPRPGPATAIGLTGLWRPDPDGGPVAEAGPGELVVAEPSGPVAAGATLGDPAEPLLLAGWVSPEPLEPTGLAPAADDDDFAAAAETLSAADPAVRLTRSADTGQWVAWTHGRAHRDRLLAQLAGGGTPAAPAPLRLALRTGPDGSLLEPLAAVELEFAGPHLRRVQADLATRRAREVTGGRTPDGGAVLRALVPAVELVGYPTAVRALAGGSAVLRRTEAGWAPAPDGAADRLRAGIPPH